MSTANGFGLYYDAALTSPVRGGLVAAQRADGTTPPVDFELYLGTPYDEYEILAVGPDNIHVEAVDDAPGGGHETTELRLALTAAGLDTATPGADLDLGVTRIDGAVAVHLRVDDATGVAGESSELRIRTTPVEVRLK